MNTLNKILTSITLLAGGCFLSHQATVDIVTEVVATNPTPHISNPYGITHSVVWLAVGFSLFLVWRKKQKTNY